MNEGADARFARIKSHFEQEARVFDKMFFKVMPYYSEMMQAVVEAMPFGRNDRLKIADLGCGTGNLSLKVLEAFPRAQLVCVDMAEKMLLASRAKLAGYPAVQFRQADIRTFNYGTYDAIVSSMVMHHIAPRQKLAFYRRLRRALSRKGVLFIIDIVLSANPHLQELFMQRWKDHMRASGMSVKWVEEMIRRHRSEDRPRDFEAEFDGLRKAGFRDVDVVLKRYNFAVYGGRV